MTGFKQASELEIKEISVEEEVVHELQVLDQGYSVSLSLCYQGISNAFPWNVLILAHNYFETKLASVPAARNFIIYFTVIFMLVKVFFVVLGVSISPVTVKPFTQITFSIFMNCLVFTVLTLICTLPIFSDMSAFYYCTLILVLLTSVFSAYAEAGFISLLSNFPAKYTQSYMVGHALAGVIAAVLNIFSIQLANTGSSEKFAGVFFTIATLIIFISLILMLVMRRLSAFRHYYRKYIISAQNRHEALKLESESDIPAVGHLSTWQVMVNIKNLVITTFVLAWAGIIMSPTLLFLTKSTDPESRWGKEYFHVTVLLLNAVFDLFGKGLPGIPAFRSNKVPIVWIALIRLIFIPLFLMGNIQIAGYELPLKGILAADSLFIVLMAIKSISGGYLMTLAMMKAPEKVQENDRSKAIAILVYGTSAGLLLGSLASLLLENSLRAISTPTLNPLT